MNDRVLRRGRERAEEKRAAGFGAPTRAREVELDQRGQDGEQDQRVQADQRDVQRQPALAVQRRRERDADLDGVAERGRDGANARRGGGLRAPRPQRIVA